MKSLKKGDRQHKQTRSESRTTFCFTPFSFRFCPSEQAVPTQLFRCILLFWVRKEKENTHWNQGISIRDISPMLRHATHIFTNLHYIQVWFHEFLEKAFGLDYVPPDTILLCTCHNPRLPVYPSASNLHVNSPPLWECIQDFFSLIFESYWTKSWLANLQPHTHT